MDKAFEIKKGTVTDVPLGLIDLDPNQPRKDFEEESLADLAADIKKVGVQQPITVQPNSEEPGRFYIVYGERRYRASKLVKKKTIPALLYNGKKSELDILLNQVKENSLRKDLNPMEMSELFFTLHKGHGLKHTEIEKTLQDHNVGKFGRAYIGNIIRLRGLPDWAKDKIRAGEMTAAHGKYLLPAMKSQVVINSVKEQIDDSDESLTTRELQDTVFYAFHQEHPELTGYKTKFDYKEKCAGTGCQKIRKCSSAHGTEATFCLDRPCYANFNAEASKRTAIPVEHNDSQPEPEQADFTVDDSNGVDVDKQELHWSDFHSLTRVRFNQADCEGCQHRHDAIEDEGENGITRTDSCFNSSCFDKKLEQKRTTEKLLIHWLESIVSTRISIDPAMCNGLLLWVAANAPDGKQKSIHEPDEEYLTYQEPYIEDEGLDHLLMTHGLTDLESFLGESNLDGLCSLAGFTIQALHHSTVLKLAAMLKVSIDDYRIDQAWLNEHTDEEIESFIATLDLPLIPDSDLKLTEGERFDMMILKHADVIGVPLTMRWVFDNMAKADDE